VEQALAELVDPAVYGGVPGFMAVFSATQAHLLVQAGKLERAREAFARMRAAQQAMPLLPAFDGVLVNFVSLGCLDEALPVLADESFLAACERFVTELQESESPPTLEML